MIIQRFAKSDQAQYFPQKIKAVPSEYSPQGIPPKSFFKMFPKVFPTALYSPGYSTIVISNCQNFLCSVIWVFQTEEYDIKTPVCN
jgi:hypothetical protein